jgi:hypothetical protein
MLTTNYYHMSLFVQLHVTWHMMYIQESIKADPAKADSYQLVDVREPNELMLAAIRSPAFLNLPLSQSNVR